MKTILDIEYSLCTGCAVCKAVCNKDAISMKPAIDGFIYPEINRELCIKCGVCYTKCHTNFNNSVWSKGVPYAGHYLDKKLLASSSSGGAATAISEYTIENGGFVYGVSFADDFRTTVYSCAKNKGELEMLKTSKYVQASPPDYHEIKKKLDENKLVTFIGLPCQCDAIRIFLERDYANLLLVSLVCHGPTSPLVLKKYVDELELSNGKLKALKLRYKKNGYTRPTRIYAAFKNGKKKIMPFITSGFGIAFEILNRESCSRCHSKYPNGYSDIIIGDFWGGKDSKSKQSECGESLIIIKNNKKLSIIDSLNNIGFELEKADLSDIEVKNPSLVKSVVKGKKRERLVNDLQNMTLKKATYKSTSIKVHIMNAIYFRLRCIIPHKIWNLLRTLANIGGNKK